MFLSSHSPSMGKLESLLVSPRSHGWDTGALCSLISSSQPLVSGLGFLPPELKLQLLTEIAALNVLLTTQSPIQPFPGMGHPQIVWETCASASPFSQERISFYYLT